MQQFQTGLLLIFVVLTVRQQNVCIMRIVSVMQGKISVEGSDACHCEGTECATFQCR